MEKMSIHLHQHQHQHLHMEGWASVAESIKLPGVKSPHRMLGHILSWLFNL